MYREEKIIDGVLHYRNLPNGKWHECTKQQLTAEIMRLRDEIVNGGKP